MSSTSGTVRALAEQLARDDDLRARLVNDPQAVLDEWGIPAGADLVPATVTLPEVAELAGLMTASEEPRHPHRPEEPEIHFGEERPEHEIHIAEEKPEIHIADEPAIHIAEEPEIHIGEEPAIHIAEEPEIHIGEEPAIHIAEEPAIHIAEEPEEADADLEDDEDD